MPRPARRGLRRLAAAVGALALAAGGTLLPAVPAAAATNTEPFAASQWALRQIGVETAWDVTQGAGARVGIIDTGVDLRHPEMAGRVSGSIRCIGTAGLAARCGGTAQDDSGHGTHVAGIVAAPRDGAGVAGVAPEASLLVVKALHSDGSGEAADVAAGIEWLLAQGVNVINLSLAETLSPGRVVGSPLEAAIRRAAGAGVVVVLAAGNHAETSPGRTAFNLPAIVVGATDHSGRLARYSVPLDTGIRWGIVAPGGDGSTGTDGQIISTYWFSNRRSAYAWSEGTSMAAPHVAGAAALLAARGIVGQAAVDRLLTTAAGATCGTGCRGLLDVRAAVGAAQLPGPQAASNPASVATPAVPPTEPVPTTSVPPATQPVAAPPTSSALPLPGPVREAIPPIGRSLALELPGDEPSGDLAPRLVLAALALLAVGVATTVCTWRRLRADEGW